MFSHYLKNGLRQLVKHKFFAIINLSGLTIGIAASLLIGLYVLSEWQFDNFHKKKDRIYRITLENQQGEERVHLAHGFPNIASEVADQVPGIERSVELGFTAPVMLGYQGHYVIPEGGETYYASEEFFEVFSFTVAEGNRESMLKEPYTIAITAALGRQIFGDVDPIGQLLDYYVYGRERRPLKVTGILDEVPENSHLQFNHLLSYATLEDINQNNANWPKQPVFGYLLLQEGVKKYQLEDQIERSFSEFEVTALAGSSALRVQALADIHLRSEGIESDKALRGDLQMVLVLSLVSIGILLMACINFINMLTARSVDRARDVGVRKAFGARRGQLLVQYLTESIVQSMISLSVAILVVESLLTPYSSFVGKQLQLDYASFWPLLLTFGLLLGLLSGIYPAWVITRTQTIQMLKQKQISTGSRSRGVLVVIQFSVALLLTVGTLVIHSQLRYIQQKDLGLETSQVIQTVIPSNRPGGNEAFKQALLAHPGIEAVGRATVRPLYDMQSSLPEGPTRVMQGNELKTMEAPLRKMEVGFDFDKALGIEMVAGRSFSEEFSTDRTEAFVLNSAAARQLGWAEVEDAIGKRLEYDGRKGQVIGVLADFNFESLHQEVLPFVLVYNRHSPMVFVNARNADMASVLASLENEWKKYATTNEPFQFRFMDEYYEQFYRKEANLKTALLAFAILSMLVICMGVLGLVNFVLNKRQKEMSIRKVLGASVFGLYALISSQFIRLVLLSSVISIPLAYYLLSQWLEQFAYRISLAPGYFCLGVVLLFVVTIITISYYAWSGARTNPAKVLRDN